MHVNLQENRDYYFSPRNERFLRAFFDSKTEANYNGECSSFYKIY